MGLIRLVIIVFLAWLVWQLVKATLARARRLRSPDSDDKAQNGEKMLPCAHCGVYVPASQAVAHRELAFCSRNHQNEYLDNHGD